MALYMKSGDENAKVASEVIEIMICEKNIA